MFDHLICILQGWRPGHFPFGLGLLIVDLAGKEVQQDVLNQQRGRGRKGNKDGKREREEKGRSRHLASSQTESMQYGEGSDQCRYARLLGKCTRYANLSGAEHGSYKGTTDLTSWPCAKLLQLLRILIPNLTTY